MSWRCHRGVQRVLQADPEQMLHAVVADLFAMEGAGGVLPARLGAVRGVGEGGEHAAARAVVVVTDVDDGAVLRGEGEGCEAGCEGIVAVDEVGGLHAVARLLCVWVVAVEAEQLAVGAIEACEAQDQPGPTSLLATGAHQVLGVPLDLAARVVGAGGLVVVEPTVAVGEGGRGGCVDDAGERETGARVEQASGAVEVDSAAILGATGGDADHEATGGGQGVDDRGRVGVDEVEGVELDVLGDMSRRPGVRAATAGDGEHGAREGEGEGAAEVAGADDGDWQSVRGELHVATLAHAADAGGRGERVNAARARWVACPCGCSSVGVA